VIGSIFRGFVTPTESAVIAAGYALILGMFVYRTVSLRDLGEIFYDTTRFASISLFTIGTASAFGFILTFFKVTSLIVDVITTAEMGVIGTGLVIAGLLFLFGLFIDAIPTFIILGTALKPAAAAAGLDPIAFAIIGIVSLSFGLVTPPHGLCLLISAAIGGVNVAQVMRDVVIILYPMLIILLLIKIYPQISLWLPKTLMPGAFP
jgi:TRAP-type C4-dicarboxylate transport system permease large subunit